MKFCDLSVVAVVSVCQILQHANGRRALALSCQRFAQVYRDFMPQIEHNDWLITRMQQLWRARYRPSRSLSPTPYRFIELGMDLKPGITSQRLQKSANHAGIVNLATIDLTALNFCTFECKTFVDDMLDFKWVSLPHCGDILRYVEFEFEKATVKQIDIVIQSFYSPTLTLVLATRTISAFENSCTMFLNFPLSRRSHYDVKILFLAHNVARNISVRHFQSFSRPIMSCNHSFINPKRWRGKATAHFVEVDETEKIVDHTPKSLQKK